MMITFWIDEQYFSGAFGYTRPDGGRESFSWMPGWLTIEFMEHITKHAIERAWTLKENYNG